MSLSFTVNGLGSFTASVTDGSEVYTVVLTGGTATFTAAIAPAGPKGDTGATGSTGPQGPAGTSGIAYATAPLAYDSGTQTVSISATPTFDSISVNTYSSNVYQLASGGLYTVNSTATSGVIVNLGGVNVFGSAKYIFPDSTEQTTAFVGEARKVYVSARNNTGSTIAAGKVVYLSGATGNKPTIALAQANAEGTSARVIGLTVESIANNSEGKVITSGVAENIDTSAFNAGDVVYLSATTAGGMTTTLPTQPYHGVAIGIVTRANANVGSVEVQVNNYQELDELSDVLVTSPANLDLLSWDSASSTWKNKTFSTLGLLTSATAASTYQTISGMSSYLTSSTAASTYAPLASPTFTGTVTIPAGASISGYLTTSSASSTYLTQSSAASTYQTQAGMSSYLTTSTAASTYAPLASPTFTGDPKAPTPATSDNDTSIATTAFVNAYCPTASTSTAGKVQLATNAQTVAGSSTTLAITPSSYLWAALSSSLHAAFANNSTTSTVSGAGTGTTANGDGWGMRVYTGTVSGNYAAIKNGASTTYPVARGIANGNINWSKAVYYSGLVQFNQLTANATFRGGFGVTSTHANTDLTSRGIGYRLVGTGALELQVHNGTTLTNVTSSFTPSANIPFDLVLYSDGSGNVTMYVNDSQVATTASGPTGTGANTYNFFFIEADNTGTLATQSFHYIGNPKVYLGY